MKLKFYPGFDICQDDALKNTDKFQQWKAYHRSQELGQALEIVDKSSQDNIEEISTSLLVQEMREEKPIEIIIPETSNLFSDMKISEDENCYKVEFDGKNNVRALKMLSHHPKVDNRAAQFAGWGNGLRSGIDGLHGVAYHTDEGYGYRYREP